MQAIIDWLNSDKNYFKGIDLYLQLGTSDFYKKLLPQRDDEFNRKKLIELLTALSPGTRSEVRSQKSEVKPTEPIQQVSDKKADNSRYLALIKKKGDLYTVLNMLKNQSRFLPDGEELRKCAVDILVTNQKLMECWALIDHYQDNGCFEVKAESEKPKVDPVKEIQYLRQSISKCRSRLKSQGCRDKAATEQLLNEQLGRLAELSPKKKKLA
jgi:hypothetical protein